MNRLAIRDRRNAGRRPGIAGGARIFAAAVALAAGAVLLPSGALDAQQPTYRAGQTVSPAYEGWTEHEDGSRSFLFGYMNRNWEEELDVPVGPDNAFSPGPDDRDQPTHFLPRRNRFVFEVPVPEGFEEDDELVWTLRTRDETKKAYATLHPDFYVDNVVIMSETGALGAGTSDPELRANEPPEVELEVGRELTARVGEPVRLVATVTDDGVPERDTTNVRPVTEDGALDLEEAMDRPGRVTVNKANGLYFAWFPYRGPRRMTFDPPQIKVWEDTRSWANSPWAVNHWAPPEPPDDDRWVTEVTFDEPGTYVLRGRADDGGLYGDVEVTVHVSEAGAAP